MINEERWLIVIKLSLNFPVYQRFILVRCEDSESVGGRSSSAETGRNLRSEPETTQEKLLATMQGKVKRERCRWDFQHFSNLR